MSASLRLTCPNEMINDKIVFRHRTEAKHGNLGSQGGWRIKKCRVWDGLFKPSRRPGKADLHSKHDSNSFRGPKHARQVVWEPVDHEFTAQLRELELIRRWRPRFNRRGRLESDRCGYICLTTDEAPHFHAACRPPRGARRSWGPVRTSRKCRPVRPVRVATKWPELAGTLMAASHAPTACPGSRRETGQ